MSKKKSNKQSKEGLNAKKDENFSEWYTDIIKKTELADLRYNIKGFLVFQPWSVIPMEKMYKIMEGVLQRKKHQPYFFPTLIPESNLKKESTHVKGFSPEVFWVTHGGKKKFKERYALRPTSETAFYEMFGKWIRSYKDLPLKAYQRGSVFRYETKATRPFLRSREILWIEAHCAHATEKDAMKQVHEDIETTEEVLHKIFGLPFIFFERPAWDRFPGASRTFAADVLNPDGKVVQQPSTHMISPNFSKAFGIKFRDKDEKEKNAHITCYGPAISRIFASIIIVHGDDKGLKFPWDIAPIQVMIVPIDLKNKKIMKKADELKKQIQEFASVEIDYDENKRPGEKFNHWEMKGIPIRIDLGMKDLEKKKITIFRRDLDKKEIISEKEVMKKIQSIAKEFTKNLREKADNTFKGRIKEVKNISEMKRVIEEGGIASCNFCSVDEEGTKCAELIEKEVNAFVRGTKLNERKNVKGTCFSCKKKANHIVYVARAY